MSDNFDVIKVFSINENFGESFNVMLTFSTEDYSKPLSVSFSDPARDQVVSIPPDLWGRVKTAIERNWEQ